MVHVCRSWRSVVFASPNFSSFSTSVSQPALRIRLLRHPSDARTPIKNAKKRRLVLERLKRFVTTGEDIGRCSHRMAFQIGTPFCKIIKEMFPESSKKRTRRSTVDLKDAE